MGAFRLLADSDAAVYVKRKSQPRLDCRRLALRIMHRFSAFADLSKLTPMGGAHSEQTRLETLRLFDHPSYTIHNDKTPHAIYPLQTSQQIAR